MIENQVKTGVLLLNIGTPAAPTLSSVRNYLKEFLSDPRVIDIPSPLRWLLLHGVILPFRTPKTLHAYKSIWTEKGSPLLSYSLDLQNALNDAFPAFRFEIAMRYGKPSIASALKKLKANDCERLIIFPLFPQYSSAATGSAIQRTLELIKNEWNIADIQIYNSFYSHPAFIHAYRAVILESLQFEPDLFLFSYHGVPTCHLYKNNASSIIHCDITSPCPDINSNNRYCYRAHCYATSKHLANALQLKPEQYRVSFQSRLGKTPWIPPYTDLLLPELAQHGIKKIVVACPSFVTDCLETLEEIGIRAKAQWQTLGGTDFQLIPCLNAHPSWVQAIMDIIESHHNFF